VPYATAVSSGTAGLHLAVKALRIGEGDEVIVPSFTFIAAANAIRYERAEPVFADIDPTTLNLVILVRLKLRSLREHAQFLRRIRLAFRRASKNS
jgi:dTDP-4-amino-4,6-dideoxygalactose transaminase